LQKPDTGSKLQELQVQQLVLKEQQKELINSKDSKNQTALEQNKTELEKTQQAIAQLFESTNPALSGKYLKDAYGSPTQGTDWDVALSFDQKGGELFTELTRKLAGTNLSIGIFLDNELISSPIVPERFKDTGIAGGAASITGNFTAQTATELAVQLKGGSLPLPVEIAEKRTVGATLGQDSIKSSIFAGVGGLVLVLVFMVLYYRLPGLIADVSLIVYALLTWAAFALLNVTLTLPGSILDSNVTTWIACAALFWLGSGLVKGFALTLALGIAVSMFSAITCSRTLMFVAISIPAFKNPELYCPNFSIKNQEEVAQ
jgi:preprotein translocase subunit SecD